MDKRGLEGVFVRLEAGVTVVTVNSRLYRYILEGYDRHMLSKGAVAWKSPVVMPIGAYLPALWSEAAPSEPLIGKSQAGALWEKVVSKDRSVDKRHFGQAAKASYEAYRLMSDYRVRLPEDDLYLSEEGRAMKRWLARYSKEVDRLGFVDSAALPARIEKAIKAGSVQVPDELTLAGFDELTPAFARLLDSLNAAGTKLSFWPCEPGSVPVFEDVLMDIEAEVYSFEDPAAEVEQAARWVRSVAGPGKRVGVIVPDLSSYRPMIEREFSSELDPASVLCGNESKGAFNISLGTALSEEPIVSSALKMISIGEAKAQIDTVSSVLLSPFFSGGEEMSALAGLDGWLKERNCLAISLYDLKGIASGRAGLEGFAGRVGTWIELLREARRPMTPGQWARHFSAVLKDTGWLRPVTLTSAEFQALRAWNRVLEELTSLDDILGQIGRAEAFSKVSGMAAEAIHQRESAGSGVDVLGLLEAAGQSFDHLWLMGCHEFALPIQPAPNPFIPAYLQKESDLPHSSHDRELRFAKTAIAGILKGAPSVIISYPKRADDKDLSVSPLFKSVPVAGDRGIDASGRVKDSVRAAGGVEPMPLDGRIPVKADELSSIRGGTAILKNQSLCPFKAFAEHRLDSRCVATPEPGLPAKERGTILHSALKAFWDGVEGSARLREIIDGKGLESRIASVVDGIFKDVRLSAPFSARFLEIEKERLAALLKDWLEKESKRPPFTVKKVEDETPVNLGGLEITLKPDRVDLLEDSRSVLIDYKSGTVDRNDWLGARPRDPQMIVYSLYSRPQAVTFARVVPGDCRFVGIAMDEGMLPGVKSLDKDNKWRESSGAADWEGLMALWRSTIEGLAKAFVEGNAEVDPALGPTGKKSPCEYCDQYILCRVAEAVYLTDDGDEGEDYED